MLKYFTFTLEEIEDIVAKKLIDEGLLTTIDEIAYININWKINGKNTTLTISERNQAT